MGWTLPDEDRVSRRNRRIPDEYIGVDLGKDRVTLPKVRLAEGWIAFPDEICVSLMSIFDLTGARIELLGLGLRLLAEDSNCG